MTHARALCLYAAFSVAACAHEPAPGMPLVLPPEQGSPQPEAPPNADSRPASAEELTLIDELMSRAEAVRGLAFQRPVPVRIQNRSAITKYIETQIEQDELESARIRYTALGLLPPGLDVRELLLRLMGEQVVGYYDPKEALFVIRDDVMRAFESGGRAAEGPAAEEARMVLIHELVHALQGQHLGLSEAVEAERDTDADNAFRALIEGDATLAMIGGAVPAGALQALTSDPAQIRALMDLVQANPAGDPELADAPPIVRETLLSAYIDGLGFTAFLYGAGGWPRVDAAHRAAPASTEHILHPDRYIAGDMPEAIALPELPELLEAGYALADEDSLGELEIGLYFGLGAERIAARRAADGWGGDRLRVYLRDGQTAVVWVSAWDSEAEAAEAERGALSVHAELERTRRASAVVQRRGRALFLLQDLEPPLKAAVAAKLEPLMVQLGGPRTAYAQR